MIIKNGKKKTMSKKLKGFSLAELLISLLVISIVLSAAIPTITKRTAQDREQIWKWSTDNNSTYFGLGANQSVLIGTPTRPLDDDSNTVGLDVIMQDDYGTSSDSIYFDSPRYSTNGDKLVILKKSLQGHTTNMANSHISFYNIQNGLDRNANSISYGGRIAADKHNIAFGRATLLHMEDIDDNYFGENTAIGHYALMATTNGGQNVAVGEKTLSHNKTGSHNTALGFLAGNKVGRVNRADSRSVAGINVTEKQSGYSEYSSENTSIGDSSLGSNETGFANTAVGSQALTKQIYGDDNTSVGYYSLGALDFGYGNTSVGANACGIFKEGNYNICIGNSAFSERNTDNYSLSIGSSPTPAYKENPTGAEYSGNLQHSVPLITGHTQRVGSITNPTVNDNNNGNFDKELIVNAKRVAFKPFNGGDYPTFIFTSTPGDVNATSQTGYGDGSGTTGGISGKAFFNLRYVGGNDSNDDSVSMQIHSLDRQAIIGTFNSKKIGTFNGKKAAAYRDISFNQVLKIDMPFKYKTGESNPLGSDSFMQDQSNFIDGAAIGVIRSTKPKVGLLGESMNETKNDIENSFDLLLNSRVNVSRFAAHIFNIDEQGTQIIPSRASTEASFEIIASGGNTTTPNLQFKNGQSIFGIPQNGLVLNNVSSGNTIVGIYNDNNINIAAGSELYLSSLGYKSGDEGIRSVIKDLDSRIDQVQQQVYAISHSDQRLKNVSGDNTAGLEEINKLEVKNYTYKKDKNKTPHVGVIAQQLQKVFPNAVTKDKDGYLMVRTEDIFYAMVNSIKELCAKLQDLTAKITGLDKRITELEAQNKLLLEQNKAFEKRLEKLEEQAEK